MRERAPGRRRFRRLSECQMESQILLSVDELFEVEVKLNVSSQRLRWTSRREAKIGGVRLVEVMVRIQWRSARNCG